MKTYTREKMAERIQEARKTTFKGTVTQKQMAAMLGVPYKTYQNWEIAKALPKRPFIPKLANFLKVDAEWLEFGPRSKAKEITKNVIKSYFGPNKKN